MANRGEEKVRVHMNVVPRSTRNTNSGLIRHLKSSPTFSVRPCSSVGRVTVDLYIFCKALLIFYCKKRYRNIKYYYYIIIII